MAIITISRGTASGGNMLAEGLADRLGYSIVTRENIVHEASKYGASEEKFQDALLKPPGFWERFKYERRRYLAFMQGALCEQVLKDDVIYCGNAGHLLLRDIAHVLCIRLIAPASFRIQLLMNRRDMTRDNAFQRIEEVDRQRREWTRFLYDVDWLDPMLYDLTINLKTLDIDGAVDLATMAARRSEFQTTEESTRSLADLTLASRVRAALAADSATASADIEVRSRDGEIHLRGRLRTASLVDSVVDVAAGVDGVERVDREELDAPDYTV